MNTNPVGQITINDENNNPLVTNAPFALISHGKDGAGAHNIEGGIVLPCRDAVGGDGENCDFTMAGFEDAIFKESQIKLGDNNNFYDDRLAFSLVDDSDDEWWSSFEDSPDDIRNKNPGIVCLGSGCTPDHPTIEAGDVLVASGNTRLTGNLNVEGNIIAQGFVDTVDYISSGDNIHARGGITAGNVENPDNVNAGSIVAGAIDAASVESGSIAAENDILAQRDLAAANGIIAGPVTNPDNIGVGSLALGNVDAANAGDGSILAENDLRILGKASIGTDVFEADLTINRDPDQRSDSIADNRGLMIIDEGPGITLFDNYGSRHKWLLREKSGDFRISFDGNEPNGTYEEFFHIQEDSGNVGIGTDSPSEKLDVAGNIELTGDILLDFNSEDITDRSGGICTNGSLRPCLHTGLGGNTFRVSRSGSAAGGGMPDPIFGVMQAGQRTTSNWATSEFFVGDTYSYFKDNVGLGKLDPEVKLDVEGDMRASNISSAAAFYYNENSVFGDGEYTIGTGGIGDVDIGDFGCADGQVFVGMEAGTPNCIDITSLTSYGGIYTDNMDGTCRYGNPLLPGKVCGCPSGYTAKTLSEFASDPGHGDYCDGFRTTCGVITKQCIKNEAAVGGGGAVPTPEPGTGTGTDLSGLGCTAGQTVVFNDEGQPECSDAFNLSCQAYPREDSQAYHNCGANEFELAKYCSGDCSGDDAKVTICCAVTAGLTGTGTGPSTCSNQQIGCEGCIAPTGTAIIGQIITRSMNQQTGSSYDKSGFYQATCTQSGWNIHNCHCDDWSQ